MKPKLVIFDCDGVLVDTETIAAGVIAANLTTKGLQLSPAQIHELFQGGTMKTAKDEAEKRGAVLEHDWVVNVGEEIKAALAKGVVVFDGLIELLDDLDAQGIATAIASNGPFDKMQVSLGPSGLWDRFDGRIYSGRAFGAPKPAPGMLLAACAQAGVDPADAVMIDDTPIGTRAADAAGMRAIGFAAASDAGALKATGHPVAHSMAEVRDLLGL